MALFRSANSLVDLGLEHVAGFEHEHLTREDGHFLACLGAAADALVL